MTPPNWPYLLMAWCESRPLALAAYRCHHHDDTVKQAIGYDFIWSRYFFHTDCCRLCSTTKHFIKGTIADNIPMGKENATIEEIIAAAKVACAHQFISEFPERYDTVLGKKRYPAGSGRGWVSPVDLCEKRKY